MNFYSRLSAILFCTQIVSAAALVAYPQSSSAQVIYQEGNASEQVYSETENNLTVFTLEIEKQKDDFVNFEYSDNTSLLGDKVLSEDADVVCILGLFEGNTFSSLYSDLSFR